jgi:hypothetical protein
MIASKTFGRTLQSRWSGGLLAALVLLTQAAVAPAPAAAQEAPPKKPSKFREFADVTKDATKHEGLIDLYEKDQHLYAALSGSVMNRPFLVPMAVARGAASAGMALNFDEQWVIMFSRVGDTVQLIRKNLRYEAPKGSPLEKAVQQNYTDSILMALPIVADNAPGGGVLVDFNDIFFTDFADLGVGGIDRQKASWHRIKNHPENIELQVKVTFGRNPMGSGSNGDYGYIDSRGITLVMHYSIVQMPDPGYRPRMADQRVGYFLNATKDFAPPRISARAIPTRRSCGGSTVGALKSRIPAQSCRPPRSKSCGGLKTPCRTNTDRMSKRAFSSGTKPSRRLASATHWRCGGRTSGTNSTPKTLTIAPSAGSPRRKRLPCRTSGPIRSPAR